MYGGLSLRRAAQTDAVFLGDMLVGAVWYRVLPQNAPGLGFVGAAVPELIVGVHPLWRSRGVGRSLLRGVVRLAGAQSYSRISLSVERDNFARNLYRAEGFVVVGQGSTRDTMVRATA